MYYIILPTNGPTDAGRSRLPAMMRSLHSHLRTLDMCVMNRVLVLEQKQKDTMAVDGRRMPLLKRRMQPPDSSSP